MKKKIISSEHDKPKQSDDLKPLSKRKIIFSYLLGLILILFLWWSYSSVKNEKELLQKQGHAIKAVIIKTVDGKRGLDIKYEFIVSGKKYSSWEKVYDTFYVGDTVNVVYYPKNPSVSRLKFNLTEDQNER